MWRHHLSDIGLLYSLVDDLQSFWQLKALDWDKLQRKIYQIADEERRTHIQTKTSPDNRLRETLEHNDDYRPLRDRLDIEIRTALEIADFLNYPRVQSIEQLAFDPPLPPNEILESAIAEAEALANYAQRTAYWWPTLRAAVRQLLRQIRSD